MYTHDFYNGALSRDKNRVSRDHISQGLTTEALGILIPLELSRGVSGRGSTSLKRGREEACASHVPREGVFQLAPRDRRLCQ